MNNNLLIVGAGAYGYVVKEVAEATGMFDLISFADDNCQRDDVAGTTHMLESLSDRYRYAIVAIGNPQVRMDIFGRLEKAGYEMPVLVHPDAYVSESAHIDNGCVIEPKSVVHSNACVGKGCLICAGSVVNHNAVIEGFCQIDCNAVAGAGAFVPKGTKVECGSVVFKK